MHIFVFPGQGSQFVGMGQVLAERYTAAREVFACVDDALGQNLTRLMKEGPLEELTLTVNAQPALMAVSLAALRVLEREAGLEIGRDIRAVAGHSLGEYAALAATGVFGITEAARLLRLRGQAMQGAVPVGQGAMAAILGLDFAEVEAVAREAAQQDICEAANDNAPGQVVISGHVTAVERAIAIAREKGAKRALLLPVSAPFHCALMAPAAQIMEEALGKIDFMVPTVPVLCNVTARPVTDPEALRRNLVKQVTGAVRWRESIVFLAEEGANSFLEIGAGKVLSGLIKRIAPSALCRSIGTPEEIEAFVAQSV
jgi:[acyl-carrier-protein] S-malonyltransferase